MLCKCRQVFFHCTLKRKTDIKFQPDQEQNRPTTRSEWNEERKKTHRPPTVISTTFCIFFHYLTTHFNQLQICVGASAANVIICASRELLLRSLAAYNFFFFLLSLFLMPQLLRFCNNVVGIVAVAAISNFTLTWEDVILRHFLLALWVLFFKCQNQWHNSYFLKYCCSIKCSSQPKKKNTTKIQLLAQRERLFLRCCFLDIHFLRQKYNNFLSFWRSDKEQLFQAVYISKCLWWYSSIIKFFMVFEDTLKKISWKMKCTLCQNRAT